MGLANGRGGVADFTKGVPTRGSVPRGQFPGGVPRCSEYQWGSSYHRRGQDSAKVPKIGHPGPCYINIINFIEFFQPIFKLI